MSEERKRWYDNTAIVVALLVFLFPIGLLAMWMGGAFSKTAKLVITGFFGAFIAFGVYSGKDNAVDSMPVQTSEQAINKEPEKTEGEKLAESLKRELAALEEKEFDGSAYRGDVKSVQLEVVLFATWAKLIKQASASEDEEIVTIGKDLSDKVKKIQSSEFPKMRMAYKDAIKDKLWLENIDVSVKGKGNSTIEFIGGSFASNKVKQASQETLSEILYMLRFKRTHYKWIKHDDEYTYYTIDSPSDSELVEL